MDRTMRQCCGLQETPHEALHVLFFFFNSAYSVISVVIYSMFELLLFIGSEEHGCLIFLPILNLKYWCGRKWKN